MIFMSLTAWQRRPGREDFERVRVVGEIVANLNKFWLQLHGGPTGYESMPVLEWKGIHWFACAGCDRYAVLVVPKCEMARVACHLSDLIGDVSAHEDEVFITAI